MDCRPHRKLDVWYKSMGLVSEVYKATSTFPKMLFGLANALK